MGYIRLHLSSKKLLLVIGILSAALTSLLYAFQPDHPLCMWLWLASLVAFGSYFFFDKKPKSHSIKLHKLDVLILLCLFAVFIPIYLFKIYSVPYQVSSDEITIMYWIRLFASHSQNDLFGLSNYFGFPSFPFIIYSNTAKLLGGVTLLNIRTIHAFLGIMIVLGAYLFFRVIFGSYKWAVVGAILVGTNHALLVISRMAMRDNIPLFLELIALFFLMRGYQKKAQLETYIGSVFAGLAFYNYFPGRIIIVLYILFALQYLLFYGFKDDFYARVKLLMVAAVGFILTVSPLITTTVKTQYQGTAFIQEQIMLFPAAQNLERDWVHAKTIAEGMLINAKQGLLAFNQPISDNGYIYSNQGYGFVDQVTGILLWMGLLIFFLKANKPKEEFLVVGSFLFLYVFFSLFITKNPSYTRYLIFLPFVVGLVIEALVGINKALDRFMPQVISNVLLYTVCAYIIFLNFTAFGHFIRTGFNQGDDIGGTARYIESQKRRSNNHYFLVSSNDYPYYVWGMPHMWYTRIELFTSAGQTVKVIEPKEIAKTTFKRPFTIFMSNTVWNQFGQSIKNNYPIQIIDAIKPDRSLLAISDN